MRVKAMMSAITVLCFVVEPRRMLGAIPSPALMIDGDGDERLVSTEKNALGNTGMDIEVYKQRLT